jgi:pyridoxine/pyridoxamine 5'-phosphate oxidase
MRNPALSDATTPAGDYYGGNNMSVQKKGLEIIQSKRGMVVNTIGLDGYPNTRIFYSHANDGYTVYFSSQAQAAKVKEIQANPKVNAYYDDTSQELQTWKNVVVYGNAQALEKDSSEYKKAVELISAKSANFKKRVEDGQLGASILFKIIPVRVKVLDFSQDPRVTEFEVGENVNW